MAKVSLNTLKNWFRKRAKPTQIQFWNTFDSFWHKDEKIPMTTIDKIDQALLEKADKEAFDMHLTDKGAHKSLFDSKVDKVEGKGLSEEDFTKELKDKLRDLKNYEHPEFHQISEVENLQQELDKKANYTEVVRSVNGELPDPRTGNVVVPGIDTPDISDKEATLLYKYKGKRVYAILLPFEGNGSDSSYNIVHNLKVDNYIKIQAWQDNKPNTFFKARPIDRVGDLSLLVDRGVVIPRINRIEINGYEPLAGAFLYVEYTKNSNQGVGHDVIGKTRIS